MTYAAAVLLGVAAGMLAGMFGVGGGILFVPTLVGLGLTPHHAAATSLLAIVPTAIVGVWRLDPGTTVKSIAETQKKAGNPVDEEAAKKIAETTNKQTVEYTRDGLIKFRLPMLTTPGTYDLATQTLTLGGRSAHFRLQNGLLFVMRPDGKTEDAFIRADATKEQFKRAGIRYGNKPAELEPPSH